MFSCDTCTLKQPAQFMDKKQVITRMDSFIPKIIIIHNTINNTCRYLERIYLNRWWFIYYPSSGSSFPEQKTKWVIHIGNKVTSNNKSNTHSKSFLYQLHFSIALHSLATAPENILDD